MTDSTKQLELSFTPAEEPEYKIRVSKRARRARIEVSPFGAVEVVVPRRYSARRVKAFVADNADWLKGILDKIELHRRANPDIYTDRPKLITLTAVGRSWRVLYKANQRERYKEQITPQDTPLLIIRDSADYKRHLQDWLQDKAREILVPWLRRKSAEIGLPFSDVVIRGQKTRWGSCSSRHIISLNRNLLFLPKPLVSYLFTHELCHTVHLNHSSRYWKVVESVEPNYLFMERQLGEGSRRVPQWAYPEGAMQKTVDST